ncbi:MAG: VOC family protein, partial [Candidatus Obscuribacterales bacterium]|nr:VOC family protein [Candidatus Obscuribacterales bacterium]
MKSIRIINSQRGYPQVIKTYGLTHIQLSVRDLETSMRFYQQLLGMKELFRFGPTA